jgi:hypothetical protein
MKLHGQALTGGAHRVETLVELGVIPVVGIEQIEVATRFKDVAHQEHVGISIRESLPHFVNVLTSHTDHEVLSVEVGAVSKRGRRTGAMETGAP